MSIQLALTKNKVYLDLCMNTRQFQSPIWCTLDCKTTQIWWLVNMEYKHSKLWLLCCYCCLMLLSPQVHIPYYSWTSGLSKYTWMPSPFKSLKITLSVVNIIYHNVGILSILIIRMFRSFLILTFQYLLYYLSHSLVYPSLVCPSRLIRVVDANFGSNCPKLVFLRFDLG